MSDLRDGCATGHAPLCQGHMLDKAADRIEALEAALMTG